MPKNNQFASKINDNVVKTIPIPIIVNYLFIRFLPPLNIIFIKYRMYLSLKSFSSRNKRKNVIIIFARLNLSFFGFRL